MTLKLLIYMSLIIWHVNSQRSQTPIMYQQNVPDIYNSGQIFFENSHYLHPQINSGYTINSHDNKFSREYDKNTSPILVDNRFEPNNKVSYGQKQIQTEQPIYQHTVQPDQKIYNEDNIHSDDTRTTIAETIILNLLAPVANPGVQSLKNIPLYEDRSPRRFYVEHPFIFYIIDRLDNLVVVAGKVVDPEQPTPFRV